MKLYEINEALDDLLSRLTVDEETGEVADEDLTEKIEALSMEKDEILQYLAKKVLNLRAEAAALKAEEDRLKLRRGRLENAEESILRVLDRECGGAKTDLGVATLSYRSSQVANVTDEQEAMDWLAANGHDDCIRFIDPMIDKNAVKRLIAGGTKVPGVSVETKKNYSLK